MPTREEAWKLLCEFTHNPNLRKHALAVEACVRAYARQAGSDEQLWGMTALLHDSTMSVGPTRRTIPPKGTRRPGPGSCVSAEEMVRAILSHAGYTGVERRTPLEHTLFACDELAGFLTACALVKREGAFSRWSRVRSRRS